METEDEFTECEVLHVSLKEIHSSDSPTVSIKTNLNVCYFVCALQTFNILLLWHCLLSTLWLNSFIFRGSQSAVESARKYCVYRYPELSEGWTTGLNSNFFLETRLKSCYWLLQALQVTFDICMWAGFSTRIKFPQGKQNAKKIRFFLLITSSKSKHSALWNVKNKWVSPEKNRWLFLCGTMLSSCVVSCLLHLLYNGWLLIWFVNTWAEILLDSLDDWSAEMLSFSGKDWCRVAGHNGNNWLEWKSTNTCTRTLRVLQRKVLVIETAPGEHDIYCSPAKRCWHSAYCGVAVCGCVSMYMC